MDRKVTVRFYEIETIGNHGLGFIEALQSTAAQNLPDREREVSEGLTMRLETLVEADGLYLGDVTRVQTENLPSHPTGNAVEPLPIDRLGHHTAFCFDPVTNIVALQFDLKMGIQRLCQYATHHSHGRSFSYLPVLQQDALDRFEDETPTKFKVRVAQVNQFVGIAEDVTDFEQGFARMGALFDAPTVEVVVSHRGADGGLNRGMVIGTIRRLLRLREQFPGVKAITAETDESPDPFNFIKDLLKRSSVLDLPANDPDAGRQIRMRFAGDCINEQLDFLRAAYGPQHQA